MSVSLFYLFVFSCVQLFVSLSNLAIQVCTIYLFLLHSPQKINCIFILVWVYLSIYLRIYLLIYLSLFIYLLLICFRIYLLMYLSIIYFCIDVFVYLSSRERKKCDLLILILITKIRRNPRVS